MKIKKSDRISCILCKILNIGIILLSIIFTPYQFYLSNLPFNSKFGLFSWESIILILMSFIIFIIGWMGLLKTNNPLSRYNPFSLNSKWKNKMDYSMDEKPGQLFDLDTPTKELISFNRDKQLKKLL